MSSEKDAVERMTSPEAFARWLAWHTPVPPHRRGRIEAATIGERDVSDGALLLCGPPLVRHGKQSVLGGRDGRGFHFCATVLGALFRFS